VLVVLSHKRKSGDEDELVAFVQNTIKAEQKQQAVEQDWKYLLSRVLLFIEFVFSFLA